VLSQQLQEPVSGNKYKEQKNRNNSTNNNNNINSKSVGIMTNVDLKAGVEPSPETCLSNKPVSKASSSVV
jgi:hypothetical protein